MKKILVIEDDEAIRENILDLLDAEDFVGIGALDGEQGVEAALEHRPDVIICDIMMPKLDGHGVLERVKAVPELRTTPFIFLTAKAERSDIRAGMSGGADDYITKPYENRELLDAIRMRLRKLEDLAQSFADENRAPPSNRQPAQSGSSGVVIRSKCMQELYEDATQAAQAPISVLLLGETGAGKDVLAREIHRRSPRSDGDYVPINITALTPSLVESELFGHEKDAFNNAKERAGVFERADGGTLFLDEIGDLSPEVQVKLLRVLEDGSVTRVGGSKPRKVDVRFVWATNRDLMAKVDEGTFREDLYYRINGITFDIPPLRERREEIVPLAERFVEHACDTLGRARASIRDDTVALLEHYHWPGNVRELKQAIDHALVLCRGHELEPRHLPAKVRGNGASASGGAPPGALNPGNAVNSAIAKAEKQAMLNALEKHRGNQGNAAKELDWSRRKFVERMKRYGIRGPRTKS